MKNIKRTVRKFGKPLGHRKGIKGKELLGYIEARIQIYLPAYLWVLENKTKKAIKKLQDANQEKDIVLLDYATNCDVLDPKKPLSHAFLIKAFVEGKYPTRESLELQKVNAKSEVIKIEQLQTMFNNKRDKEISSQSKIRKNIVEKIRLALNENEMKNIEDLSKIRGIGKTSLKKLEDYINNNQPPKNNQPTLFS